MPPASYLLLFNREKEGACFLFPALLSSPTTRRAENASVSFRRAQRQGKSTKERRRWAKRRREAKKGVVIFSSPSWPRRKEEKQKRRLRRRFGGRAPLRRSGSFAGLRNSQSSHPGTRIQGAGGILDQGRRRTQSVARQHQAKKRRSRAALPKKESALVLSFSSCRSRLNALAGAAMKATPLSCPPRNVP